MNDIECPYCGCFFDDSDYYENEHETTYELQCPECHNYMAAYYSMWPSFTVEKAPCMNGEDHEWEKVHGIPEVCFKYIRRCKWCDEEICIDKEAHKKEMQEYVDDLGKDKEV